MLRAALYARYSTDSQNPASVEDQLVGCRKLAAQIGAVVVAEFSDAAISGQATANRPGFMDLMALARAGHCDMVIAEHTDRLSRAGSGGWKVFEDLEDLGIAYRTVHEGEVTVVDQGVSSLVSALKIKEARIRTRRGLEGVIRSGRSAGGMAYGYRNPPVYDAKGERVRGLREIDPQEAEIVRRIFTEYASGRSPLSIADGLNRDSIAGPRGDLWKAASISGNPKRKTGILQNEIYRGVRVWGRLRMVKDRGTGKRRTAMGNGDVLRHDAGDLRIIPDALWAAVQAKRAELAIGPQGEGSGQRRPTKLLSGLIRCGMCGSAMTAAGRGGYLRCTVRTSRGHGACANNRNPDYRRIEGKVLEGIRANLLNPHAIAEAVKAFRETIKTERRAVSDNRGPMLREIEDLKRRGARLVREVEEGMPWSAVKDRHREIVARQEALERALAMAPAGAEVVRLHPNAAAEYRDGVARLTATVDGGDASEARNKVRRLIEEVRFIPLPARGAFALEITADLMPVLGTEQSALQSHASDGSTVTFHPPARVPVIFRMEG